MRPSFEAFSSFYCLLLLLQSAQVFSYYYMDATSWSAFGGILSGPIYSNCGGTLLLGGFCVLGCSGCSQIGYYFQRVYTSLPAHNYIRFSMTFWAIDSWDLNQNGHDDGFQLYFDGTVIDGWHMSLGSFPYQICGSMTNGWNELPNVMITGLIAHTGSSLTLRVVSDLNEDSCNESFGFRDIQILFDQNAASSTVNSICGSAPVTLPNKNCACPVGQYRSGGSCYSCYGLCSSCVGPSASDCYGCITASNVIWDGTKCTYCDSPCATCSGASTNCLTCISGYYLISWTNQCVRRCPWPLVVSGASCISPSCSIDQFFMWDGVTCSNTCPAPYQPVTEMPLIKSFQLVGELPVVKLCLFPCSPVEYLYWDGTCGQDCGSPLVISTTYDGRKLCNFPCTFDYQYAYWDGSCGVSCDPPRIINLQSGRRICRQPCLDGQYLYWTGECMNTCPIYHTTPIVGSILYCNYPCGMTQYLYWDGVCRGTCPFPLNTRVQFSRQYCDYPTNSGNYLYWDGSSGASCPLPFTGTSQYTASSRLFCDYACEWGYTYWDLSCVDECPYPLTKTVAKNRQYCGFPCIGSNYLYWNGTCSSGCTAPLVSTQYLSKNFCEYPCLSSQYLYWDGACSFTCSGIFVIRQEGSLMVRNFCDFPCLPEYYYYWNSSCISVCPPPLIASTDRGRLYCNFPCLEGQFYYYNGSCSYICDRDYRRLVMSSVEKYCVEPPKYVVTCNADDFYYWNNTCHRSCPVPLVQAHIGDKKWCIYPCSANQFLYENGTCLETCESPFTERNELGYKYCGYTCEPSEYSYWNNTCLPSCPMPFRHEMNWYGVNCLLPCESLTDYYDINTEKCVSECASPSVAPGDLYPICLLSIPEGPGGFLDLILKAPEIQNTMSLVTIPIILASVRYINMPLPPRVQSLVNSQGREIISMDFGNDMPQSLQNSFTKRPLPEVFEERGLHSSFIVNFWSKLMSWLLIITALLIFIILERLCLIIGLSSVGGFFGTLQLIIKWSLCLEAVATSAGDVVFYSLVEFISLDPHKPTSYSSILLLFTVLSASLVLAGAIFNLIRSCSVLKKSKAEDKNSSALTEFLERWKEFEVLFSGFRGHSNLNQYFFLLYMFRIAFPMVIAVLLRSWPFPQLIVQFIFSFIIVTYLLTAVPLARKINFMQLFLVEGLAFIVNFSLLLLYLLNIVDAVHSREYNLLGDIVVGGCSVINLMEIVFTFAKIFDAVLAIDRYIMANPDCSRTIWLQMFNFIGQQCGMGFEEMFVNSEAAKIFNAPKYLIGEKVKTEKPQTPPKQLEQETTLISLMNSSKLAEPPKIIPIQKVVSISKLIPKKEVDPYYWLNGITRAEGQAPKNALNPRTLEFVKPDDVGGRSARSPGIQNLKSHDSPFRNRSMNKNKKKQGGRPKIIHL